METKKITPEMYEALKKPLPKEAVKPHPTKTFLSSIKAIYVTERLNEVFGCGAWTQTVEHITTTDKSMVVVKVTLTIPEYGVYYESYGGNDNGGENSKNFDLGDAYKGATTDGITKIGSYLGIGIDVFKGLVSAPKANTTSTDPNQPELPWLNEKDAIYPQIVEAVKNGTRTIAMLREKFKISKATEAALTAFIPK